MATPRLSRAPLRFLTGGVLAAALTVLFIQACSDNPTDSIDESMEAADEVGLGAGLPPKPDTAKATPAALTSAEFPFTGVVNSTVPAFNLLQDGGGIAGRFEIRNPNSAAIALDGVTSGTGHALLAWNLGLGRAAVVIASNNNNTLPALDVSSQSQGTTTLAAAADIRANNTTARNPAVQISTLGMGPALKVNHKGPEGGLALFQVNGTNRIRFARDGKGFFNGGVRTSGADVAEAFEVEGEASAYEPGDVLVISVRSDRTVERSNEPYSTLIAGVYATRPGVLLTERGIDEGLDGTVPLGVVGVIPTKVSAENGAIHRGDLLVSAGTPGHAMRGESDQLEFGMVLGKALENFSGPGTGIIRVLVTVR